MTRTAVPQAVRWSDAPRIRPHDPLSSRLAVDWNALEQACEQADQPCWCCSPRCWCTDVGRPQAAVDRLHSGDDLLALRLLVSARQGDTAAARVLLQAMLPLLEDEAMRRGTDLASLLGQAWEQVLRHRPRTHSNVLVNLARASHRQSAGRRPPISITPDRASDLHSKDAEPSQRSSQHWARELIESAFALGVINSETAEWLEAIHLDGHSPSEVAVARGLSAGQVRERCRRARRRMAQQLSVQPLDAA